MGFAKEKGLSFYATNYSQKITLHELNSMEDALKKLSPESLPYVQTWKYFDAT